MPSKETPAAEPTIVKTEYIYAGRRLDAKGKIGYFFVPASDPAAPLTSWQKLNASGSVIGAVYTFSGPNESSIYVASQHAPRYTRPAEVDPQLVLDWQLRDREAANTQKLQQMEKAASKDLDILKEQLAPIKDLIKKNPFRRRAIIAALLAELWSY